MLTTSARSTLSAKSLDVVDAHWASEFGCGREELRPPVPRVQAHAGGLEGYPGVFILTLDAAPVVSVPPELLEAIAPRAETFVAEAIGDPAALRRLLSPADVTRVIGPAQLTYADAASFAGAEPGNTRELSRLDHAAFDELKAACSPEDWAPKGLALDARPTFGAFGDDGKLRAVAGFEIWSHRIAHLSVVADPAARGQGHGTRAVAAAARSALDANLVLQYRVLKQNLPSVRVAAKLGFELYGWSMAARLARA
jgi:RimJ/RimL family protein N-acetyltransferase